MKIRLSKKFVLIVGGMMVLFGGTGAAAVFVGTDKLLGPSYLELNGLECTTLKTDKITRNHRTWVRKYVISDESGDGMARIKTALRVARAVQEKEKADLVQVAMLDKSGPTERAEMRGRAIGAQVVYIADPSKAPEGARAQTYSAYYVDGSASAEGEYFGLRIDLPLEDVEALSAKLTDKADCIDPAAAEPEGEKASGGHGGKAKPKAKGGEHGAAAEGEAPAGEGHGVPAQGEAAEEGKPAAEGHGSAEGKEAEGEEQVASKDSGGFLSSVTSLVFGSKEAEKPAEPTQGHGEGEAHPAEGHGADAEDHAAPTEGHGTPVIAPAEDAASPGNHANPEDQAAPPAHGAPEGAPQPGDAKGPANEPTAHGDAAAAEPPEKKQEAGFLSSVKGMIFGSSEDEKPADAKQEASVDAKPSDNPPPPRTAAEGGKRWSSQDASDAVHSGDAPDAPAAHVEAAPAPGDGTSAADAAGEAWLAKFREQQATAEPAGHEAQPAH